jgi:glycerol kinase
MIADMGTELVSLKADGSMTNNDLLMQFQADLLGVPVIRPKIIETTALGVAYAAGLAVGFWKDIAEIEQQWAVDKSWEPDPKSEAATQLFARWKKAVTRSFGWIDENQLFAKSGELI